MKKKITILAASTLLSMLIAGSAWAVDIPSTCTAVVAESLRENAMPRAEQTQWYYRTLNGQMQRRLWSKTEAKWLTDWMDV